MELLSRKACRSCIRTIQEAAKLKGTIEATQRRVTDILFSEIGVPQPQALPDPLDLVTPKEEYIIEEDQQLTVGPGTFVDANIKVESEEELDEYKELDEDEQDDTKEEKMEDEQRVEGDAEKEEEEEREDTGKRRWRKACQNCGKVFKNKRFLQMHNEVQCQKVDCPDRTCPDPECREVCISRERLKTHRNTCKSRLEARKLAVAKRSTTKQAGESRTRRAVCQTCGQIFKSSTSLLEHNEQVQCLKAIPEGKTCPICGAIFSSKRCLAIHKVSAHSKTMAPRERMQGSKLICEHCGREFASVLTLREHIKDLHLNRGTEKCPICGKFYFQLANHIRYTHEKKRSGECPICLKTVQLLKSHMRDHNREQLPCKECGKTFPGEKYLKKHMKHMHFGGQRYTCLFCPNVYNSSPFLHMRNKHGAQFAEYMEENRQKRAEERERQCKSKPQEEKTEEMAESGPMA